MKKGRVFVAACGECDVEYTSKVKKSAQYMLRRHCRDVHRVGIARGMQTKAKRLEAARKYKDTCRMQAIALAVDGLFMVIVCPRQREEKGGFYTDTRRHFMERGVARSNVRRLFSYSLGQKLPYGWTQADASPHRFLGKVFVTQFIPRAKELFANGAKFVCWCEDDCSFSGNVMAADIAKACMDLEPSGAWMGFYPPCVTIGPPQWGAHLIGFTAASFEQAAPVIAHSIDQLDKCAIDTVFQRLAADRTKEPVVKATPKSLAVQLAHPFKGRLLEPASKRKRGVSGGEDA